jgi:hypothetical protein
VSLFENLRVRWAWRRRFVRSERRADASPYGYALPRDGLAPALIGLIVVAAIAAGGWLGMQIGGGGTAPTPLFELQSAPGRSATALHDAIEALSGARAAGRRDLATASTPAEQAAAALALRRANERAAVRVDAAEPALAHALHRSAEAYKALAAAAEDGDRRAYARASTAVASAERDLERLIGSVL